MKWWDGKLGCLCVVFLVMTSGIRQAPADEAKDKALKLHRQGVELFKSGKYIEASDAFRQAQATRPTWKLYYNIGQCEASAKRYGLALEAFESYLVEGGDEVPDDRREYVVSEIGRIQPLIGVLNVQAPGGTEVLVDGALRATMPLAGPVRLAVGRHEVVLKKGDETLLAKTVNVAGGMTTTVEYVMIETPATPTPQPEPAAETPASPEPAEAPPVQSGSRLGMLGWVGIGVGAAAGLTGVITGSLALSRRNELEDNCPQPEACAPEHRDLKESADNLALVTDILIPVGVAFAATGVVLLILNRSGEKEQSDGVDVGIAPWAGPRTAGLTVEGRF